MSDSAVDIHPSSLVHPKAQLDIGVKIGPWCVVGEHVRIGKKTHLRSHVVIEGDTALGEENVVFPFAVLGGAPQDLKYRGEPTQLRIGNRNTIRESVTINLGTVTGDSVTRVGDGNLLMAYVHLGHDCFVHNHCVLANSVGLAGHVHVHDYAILGGMTGVSQFVRVGAHSYVAGQSGVDKDVLPYSTAIGSRPFYVKGTNIVGLKRRGFSAQQIGWVHDAIQKWISSDLSKDQALKAIEGIASENADAASTVLAPIIQFIRTGEHGIARYETV